MRQALKILHLNVGLVSLAACNPDPVCPHPLNHDAQKMSDSWTFVGGGSARLGSNEPGPDGVWNGDFYPRVRVRVTKPFLIARTETTVRHWARTMGDAEFNPAICQDCAISLGTNDIFLFLDARSRQDGFTPCYSFNRQQFEIFDIIVPLDPPYFFPDCTGYRLPTHAEWQVAAQAGSPHDFLTGNSYEDLYLHAYAGDYPGREVRGVAPRVVSELCPNDWGLYDVLGNVTELIHHHFDYHSIPEGDARTVSNGEHPTPESRIDPVFTGPWFGLYFGCDTDTVAKDCAISFDSYGRVPGVRLVRTVTPDMVLPDSIYVPPEFEDQAAEYGIVSTAPMAW